MKGSKYANVCYRTEQRDEQVSLRNLRTGKHAISLGCTTAGETLQVRLDNGELDSWERRECIETTN